MAPRLFYFFSEIFAVVLRGGCHLLVFHLAVNVEGAFTDLEGAKKNPACYTDRRTTPWLITDGTMN